MLAFELLAEAFRYPYPGLLQRLQDGCEALPAGRVRADLERFLQAVQAMSLAEWEELYTRTFDLNPLVAPYLGFHRWGESYARGDFMAKLNAAYTFAGVDTHGELPDHLAPVFGYLAVSAAPLADLLEILPGTLKTMQDAMQKADADNPYLLLLKAASHAAEALEEQPAGG